MVNQGETQNIESYRSYPDNACIDMKQDFSFLAVDKFQSLLDAVNASGYQCIGPRLQDGTICYGPVANVSQLPKGVTQTQLPGRYTIHESDTETYFAWANGPQAFKPHTFAARETLWTSQRGDNGKLEFQQNMSEPVNMAFIGVRACDIAALFIHDKHFFQEKNKDPYYASRRQNIVIVAVNCTHPAETCFCASTGDGPEVEYGYDLALTEIEGGFIVHAHSNFGIRITEELQLIPATGHQLETATAAIQVATRKQTRQLPSINLKDALFKNLLHPRWDEVAERCLSCGNCTMVCPTCFCHSEFDEPALDGFSSQHIRQWDSCFTPGHSYIHGMTIRAATKHRYRQWLTHKLGSWHDQYGRSGCVGCGRCITWCPVGIDMTEEVSVICGDS